MTSPIRELGNGTWWTTVSRSSSQALRAPTRGLSVQKAVETGFPKRANSVRERGETLGEIAADSGAVR